jgi:hypothetical protein
MRRFRNSLSILVLLYAAVSLIGITPSMAEDTYFGGGIGVVEYLTPTLMSPGAELQNCHPTPGL